MATFIIFSKVSPDAFKDPADFKKLAERVAAKLREECPGVLWKDSYATAGRVDVVDIIEAENAKQAMQASMIIRAYGHSMTETLPATPWKEFLNML
jgi:uncharacterized protein with GYD domain